MRPTEPSVATTTVLFIVYALCGIGMGWAVARTGLITGQMGALLAFLYLPRAVSDACRFGAAG